MFLGDAGSWSGASERTMRLTNFSDYAIRLLMYAAAHGNRLITIEETADVYGLSRAHLMKIANLLTREGYLKAVRGRSGGLTLAKSPDRIGLGDIVRATEPDFQLVECFTAANRCVVTRRCRFQNVLHEALAAFMETLDGYTLADVVLRPGDFGVRTTQSSPRSARGSVRARERRA